MIKLKALLLSLVALYVALIARQHPKQVSLGGAVSASPSVPFSVSIAPDPVAGWASSSLVFSISQASSGKSVSLTIDSKLYAIWGSGKALSQSIPFTRTGKSHQVEVMVDDGVTQSVETSTVTF